MAVQLQLVFSKTDEQKNDLAILKRQVKDDLEAMIEYQDLLKEEEVIRQKKRQIINSFNSHNKDIIDKIALKKLDLDSQKQLLSDVAIKEYLAGKTIQITDKNGFILEPVFSVKFRKTGEVANNKSVKISKGDLCQEDEDFFAR